MRILIITVAVIAILILIGQPAFLVDMKEQVIVLQMGRYVRTIKDPGLHFKFPFIQSVTRLEKRVLVSDAPPGEYLTLDKKRLVVDHVTRWKITEPLTFYKTVHDEYGALARLQPIVFSEMRDELASYNFVNIISVQREAIMISVGGRAREKMREFGIEVIDVRIKRADLPVEVQASVFGRMQAERQRIAKKYRAEGEEEAFKLRAEADREKVVILALAYEESQTLRGEGDAQATAIYAAAYERDPEFYSFLRSLQAYETFLAQKTILVLGSDSDLFKYLESPEIQEKEE